MRMIKTYANGRFYDTLTKRFMINSWLFPIMEMID